MARCGGKSTRPFRAAAERWRHIGGAVGKDGQVVTKPWLLVRAELVDGLCQRWGCRPSQLMQEDADEVLQMLACLAEGRGQPLPSGDAEGFTEADLGLNMKSLGG